MKEVTVILTSCDRIDLLERTLKSFYDLNDYPIKEFLIHNDGSDKLFNPIMDRYPDVKFFFSGSRIGQLASLDFLLSKVKTEYVFLSEDDWHYYRNPGFIKRSIDILENNKDINQVWIRDLNDHSHPHGKEKTISGIRVKEVLKGYQGFWNGFSFNPGLRRMSDLNKMFPEGLKPFGDEAGCTKHVSQFNYKAVSLVESSIKHLGWNRRSINFKA